MAQKRPNFVFILTDDQGWEDLGCFGHSACFGRYKIQTPVLDKLASEGVRVTNFYVNSPVCSPSRVGFMTGQYPARHGIDFAIHGQAAEDQAIGQKNLLEPSSRGSSHWPEEFAGANSAQSGIGVERCWL